LLTDSSWAQPVPSLTQTAGVDRKQRQTRAGFRIRMIYLRPCQHDNGYMDGRSLIKVHTDERTQVHIAKSSLAVTHLGTNRARRYLTSVTESPNKHWSPLCAGALTTGIWSRTLLTTERQHRQTVFDLCDARNQ
jgi:hypothetical protein